jgi:hypothetical protein
MTCPGGATVRPALNPSPLRSRIPILNLNILRWHFQGKQDQLTGSAYSVDVAAEVRGSNQAQRSGPSKA